MKKFKKWIVSALCLIMIVGTFAGCAVEDEKQGSSGGEFNNEGSQDELENSREISGNFAGVVSEILDGEVIVAPNEGEEILSSGDLVIVNIGEDEDFAVGDNVLVFYDGELMESYPLQVNVVLIEKVVSEEYNEEGELPIIDGGEIKQMD
jgi:hypothetical protein